MITFDAFAGIADGAPLESLAADALTDLQRALSFTAYAAGKVDGALGPRTGNAWAEFKHDIGEPDPGVVSTSALTSINQRAQTFDALLSTPAPDVASVKAAIVQACEAVRLPLKSQFAYVLATAQWETNHTFQPVREAYWLDENWRKTHLAYYPYYGRGYVQVTWKDTYANYGKVLGLDLVAQPDLALNHYVSLFTLTQGFKTGAFSGHRLEEYVNGAQTDFVRARFCINGQDKAAEIAALAHGYLATL